MVRPAHGVGYGFMGQIHAVIQAGELVRALHPECRKRLFVCKISDLNDHIPAHGPEGVRQAGEGVFGDGQEILPRRRAGRGEAGGGAGQGR